MKRKKSKAPPDDFNVSAYPGVGGLDLGKDGPRVMEFLGFKWTKLYEEKAAALVQLQREVVDLRWKINTLKDMLRVRR